MPDIVQRLRSSSYPGNLCDEAADEIERMRKKIAGAREALEYAIDAVNEGLAKSAARTALTRLVNK